MTAPVVKIRSAGIVPVRLTAEGPLFLLLRAYRYWDFPKGEVGPGESPREAAARELAEETGLVRPVFRWGPGYVETPVYGRGKVARYYLAEVTTGTVTLGINPELARPEHHEYRWLGYENALALLNPRVAAVLRWAKDQIDSGPDGTSR